MSICFRYQLHAIKPNSFSTGQTVIEKQKSSNIQTVSVGKKIGTYVGKVAIRSTGSFNISTKNGLIQGISHKFCKRIHAKDGYSYAV